VTLRIRAGERVGIIGRTGSGKSTIGRLCLGLYLPQEGSVRFGGIDLRQLHVADLRHRIGYVSQDLQLFYGSIRDNITFGAPYVDSQAILRAAALAGVTDFVRGHPAGFDWQVGERGANLSGGQRQALAIARALLLDPEVLIFDEPTSAMDNAAEALFRQRLGTILEGKTLLLFTHRTSMLQLVDRVVVMDGGRVVADGPKIEVLTALRDGKIAATR
jgi:ATP-binding cassette subfamily C protein LapB